MCLSRVLRRLRIVFFLTPLALFGDVNGPDPGLTSVPGEAGTCTNCHGAGASSVNTGGGGIAVNFGGSKTYVPGIVQHWIITVTDPSARRWGFQATARVASSTSTVAGGFTSTDSNTQVICSNSRLAGSQRTTTGECPTAALLMYIGHTNAGTRLGTTGSITFGFDWKAPATDVGPVTVYVAANAANGNNQDDTGDHIYNAKFTLTPAATASPAPAISSAGVVNGASFTSGIEAGSWVTIQGANLSSSTRTWTSDDFANGTPTSLDGVSVTLGGKPAYVYYVSPTQINVQAPDIGTGTVSVSVTNANGASNTMTATADAFAPAFFTTGKYAIATHTDGTLVAPAGAYPGSTPAKRGETVILWGTGFGPVSPAVPPGQTSSTANGNTVSYVTT